MDIFHIFGHYLARAGDALHLSPRHDVWVPRVAVLVVIPLPGAAPRGQDVEAAPLSAHVVEFLAVVTRDDRVLVLRLLLRALRGHGQVRGGTHFTAGQGVRSDGFADQTRRQARTFLFVTIHCQGFLLKMHALIEIGLEKLKVQVCYLCYLNESNLCC